MKILRTTLYALTLLCGAALTAGEENSPVGYWMTIDDNDGKPRGIVKIEEVNGELVGHIVKVFPRPGEEENPLCVKCKGEMAGKRAIGMRVLWGMKRDGDEWNGGGVMDPDNGETYKGYLKLHAFGRKLKLRGYVGISLFGRSQEWVRQPNFKETTTK
ncbi:MAG TPA: DUF2147 domain-containing protein [bacterium]|nr:DUF2147 domain-containing protein [bacterium]